MKLATSVVFLCFVPLVSLAIAAQEKNGNPNRDQQAMKEILDLEESSKEAAMHREPASWRRTTPTIIWESRPWET